MSRTNLVFVLAIIMVVGLVLAQLSFKYVSNYDAPPVSAYDTKIEIEANTVGDTVYTVYGTHSYWNSSLTWFPILNTSDKQAAIAKRISFKAQVLLKEKHEFHNVGTIH